MWEAIRANTRRSNLLIGLMAALLVGFGALAAAAFIGPDTAWAGALLALAVWLGMLLVAWTGGDRVALATAGARPLTKEDAPQLWNITEEMTIAAGLGQMPRLYLIDDDAPNAFATASRKGPAAVAVTAGLLRRLNRDELQGVIAHEIGHIKNQDVQFMTLALVMVGSIALMADIALRALWYGGGRRRSSGKGGGQAQAILIMLTLVAAILAPLFARLLYFACSRQREYLADASSARFTRYPAGLASALEKIAAGLSRRAEGAQGLRALAPLYIVTPLAAAGGGMFASHPPTAKRIEILRRMAGGAGWQAYENAYRQVLGGRARCLEPAILRSEGTVATRAASVEAAPKQAAGERARDVADLLDRMADFLLITCACGMRIKVPEEADDESVTCPRCGRAHAVPRAEVAEALAAAAALKTAARATAEGSGTGTAGGAAGAAAGPLTYRRRGSGWESFRCACGKVAQVSPSLSVSRMRCRGCGRRIEIEAA